MLRALVFILLFAAYIGPEDRIFNDKEVQSGKKFYQATDGIVGQTDVDGLPRINSKESGAPGQGDTVNLRAFGAVLDGETDNSTILQKAVKSEKVIVIDGKVLVRGNIYIYGNARLLGKDGGQIIIDGDFANQDGRKYAFNCGITSRKGANKVWTGWIKNIHFIGTSQAEFNYCIQLHNVNGVSIESNIFDFTHIPQSSVKGDARGCAVEGLNDRGWNAGSMVRKNILIRDNRVLNRQDNHGHEALGVGNAENVVIDNNYCYGMGDDGIGLHRVKNFQVSNNRLFLVDGRILISNSQFGKVYNNYIEKIPMQNERRGEWANSDSFISLIWENKQKNALNNNDIQIYGNTFILPENYKPLQLYNGRKYKTTYIRVKGAENCIINDNTFVMQCDDKFVQQPIVIEKEIKKTIGLRNEILVPFNIRVEDNEFHGAFDQLIGGKEGVNLLDRQVDAINNKIVR